jgi:hypothetical protein
MNLKNTTTTFPTFDFGSLNLTSIARRQLAKIYRPVQSQAHGRYQKTDLRDILCVHAFDRKSGIYVPLSQNVYLNKRLPTESKRMPPVAKHSLVTPFPAVYFMNPLIIPENYGTVVFNADLAPNPSSRVANAGFIIVTIEHDCKSSEEFEEVLGWTRGPKGESTVEKVDDELCNLREYRGYSAVFSGDKSIHYHFLFSLEHLENAPCDADSVRRLLKHERTSALIANAHAIYWDHVDSVFIDIASPSIGADRKLRSVTQFRRSPWAIRILAKRSVLGIPQKTAVPQLVIKEDIRTRAPRGSTQWLVPETFSTANPRTAFKSRSAKEPSELPKHENADEMIQLLQELCYDDWGTEFPKPVGIGKQNGDRRINFKNHEMDKNPATFVLGNFRMLDILGSPPRDDRQLFLPDGMTANEMVNYVAARCGHVTLPPLPLSLPSIITATPPGEEPSRCDNMNPGLLARYKAKPRLPIDQMLVRNIEKNFSLESTELSTENILTEYRRRLQRSIDALWFLLLNRCVVIKSVEGIGKSTIRIRKLFEEMMEAVNSSLDDDVGRPDVKRFSVFASRSTDQVKEKAFEIRNEGYRVHHLRTFWDYYEEVCTQQRQDRIPRHEFDERTPGTILDRIRKDQPSVYDGLEDIRKALWSDNAPFDGSITALAMTHKAAEMWDSGFITRAWLHPEFDPNGAAEDHRNLRNRFILSRVVMDDPELDDFIYVLPQSTYEFLHHQQEKYPNWRNEPYRERQAVYVALKQDNDIPGTLIVDFDSFDQLMRVNLERLTRFTVDYNAIPFGYGNTNENIYKKTHGRVYYIGVKDWLRDPKSRFTFLTTEDLVFETIKETYNELREEDARLGRLVSVDLDDVSPIFPIKLSCVIDARAAADRENREKITSLVCRIRSIADSHSGASRTAFR